MEVKAPKNQKSNSNSEESPKNEEYLLGFNSQYKTNVYKEGEPEEEIKEIQNEIKRKEINKKLSADSTTISISQEYNNYSIDYYDYQRKMSSPLFDYFKGSDNYLSKIHERTVDMRHSLNFIKKDNFFGINTKAKVILNNINNIYQNNKDNNKSRKDNIISGDKNNSKQRFSYNYKNGFNSINDIQINNNINNINNYNNNYINNNYLLSNNNYPQQIFNINYINLNNYQNVPRINNNNIINKRKMTYSIEGPFIGNYFNNILNQNSTPNQNQQNLNPILFSYNEEQSKLGVNNNKINSKKNINNAKIKRKPFDIREGDWKCPKCNNLNFSFRKICNRCQIPKPENIVEDEN